jgi:antitoxin Phd
MTIDTKMLISMTEADQDFSKAVRAADENGMAVILKDNQPRYMLVPFAEYDEIQAVRARLLNEAVDKIIDENLEAFEALAQ